jgi:pseudaminic acid synthase
MKIKIKNKFISEQDKPFLIAEISANHKNSIKKTYRLLSEAKKIGVDAVKFQTFDLNEMTLNLEENEFLIKKKFKTKSWNNRTLYSIYKEAQLPFSWHKKIFNKAKKLGLIYFSSVFDEKSLKFLEKLDMPMYKIASLESNHFPLIKKVCKTKKPLIISTGTLSIKEIDFLIKFLKKNNCKNFVILHCVTQYPADYKNINLKTIKMLRKKYKCLVGYSDHAKGIGVALGSIGFGASVIEKHFMLNANEKTLDSNFSSDVKEMKLLVEEIKNSWTARGKVKKIISSEEKVYKNYRRSIYVTKNIKKGEKFTTLNLKVIRPGFGLEPKYYEKILGKFASKNLKIGEPFKKIMAKI